MKEFEKQNLFIRIIYGITNILLLAMFVVVMLGVITRYILASPLFWCDELSRFLMIYMVFFGSVLAFKEGKHPALTFIIEKWPEKVLAIWKLCIDIILITVLIFVIISGISMMTSGPVGYSAALRVRYSWVYFSIPFGCICMIIQILFDLKAKIISLKKYLA
ncbi:TRAP transporter small permease [Clostridium sp.]|uniref:TRAP transporter small permease n=1 Tax=Clostridium sp. TaxID=1506 RepID=UPI001A4F96A5|nr:TRAP transporter small permease [Clostridium sp.]MBK5242947.1 TRAP transporter small permease [Clostridium sp.]